MAYSPEEQLEDRNRQETSSRLFAEAQSRIGKKPSADLADLFTQLTSDKASRTPDAIRLGTTSPSPYHNLQTYLDQQEKAQTGRFTPSYEAKLKAVASAVPDSIVRPKPAPESKEKSSSKAHRPKPY